jgi:hypothetical protein
LENFRSQFSLCMHEHHMHATLASTTPIKMVKSVQSSWWWPCAWTKARQGTWTALSKTQTKTMNRALIVCGEFTTSKFAWVQMQISWMQMKVEMIWKHGLINSDCMAFLELQYSVAVCNLIKRWFSCNDSVYVI